MNNLEVMTAAAKGSDLEDLLDHIAWQEVVLPEFARDKELLTKQLIDMSLEPQQAGGTTREQVAGKLFGINWAIKRIEEIVRKGRAAQGTLRSAGIPLGR